ncbi:Crp/Fnr family transcriptional regulator [Rivularia sp. UHCC 0363]|uniref:Crp/Fnr family transcriptional regulator n=1 Tax=Rivularia sp. UHCC 0363 TaxID=3110244 RepID=UPI002B1EB866|nr:Crp/Fnr family transcriptional regulator [Rivularia sp. UHCC 0363]MEA5593702.1 Crp/Fnr family transcriptional regulator [Rivularia sp. UHCC 0363]
MLTSVDRLLFVRQVPIFKELRDDFIVRLASAMNELWFPPNSSIFQQGEQGQSLYIVVSGKVKIHLNNRTLEVKSQGKYFGEMAVFDTQPRSASATTIDACEFLELTQEQLDDAIEETPEIAVNIIRELSRLIRKLNNDVSMMG